MKDHLLFAAFAISLLATLRRPWIGVLVYVCLAYLNPGKLCYGSAVSFPFSFVAVIVLLVSLLVSREPKRLPITRETIILILFGMWMTITTFTALNPEGAWPKWNRAIKILFMVLVLMLMMKTRSRLNSAVWMIVLSLGFYGVRGAVGTVASGGAAKVFGPDDTFIADNNDLALALVTIIPLTLFAITLVKPRLAKLALIGLIGCIAIAVVGTYSRAGLLALIAVLLTLCWRSRHRFVTSVLVIGLAGVLYAVAPSAWFERMQTIGHYQDDRSAMGRINAWRFSLNLTREHPVTGGGFEAFTPQLFEEYAPDPGDYHAAHSIYFKILGEHGYIGLILFVSLWVSTWFTANRVRKSARRVEGAQWMEQLAGMAQVAMVGYGVGGAFGNQCYFDLPYHVMAIVVACKVCLKHLQRNESAEVFSEEPGEEKVIFPEPVYEI